jgi:ComF family protein
MNVVHQLLSYFLPQGCLSCRSVLALEEEGPLCPHCFKEIKYLSESHCSICGDPFPHEEIASHVCGECLSKPPPFEWARSLFELEPTLAKVIHSFKYRGSEVPLPWFSGEIAQWLQQQKLLVDCIVPVPLHRWRLLQRGYNQSLLLSRSLAKIMKVPVDDQNLFRKYYEKPQVLRSREERLKQVTRAFEVKKASVFKKKKLLLIDDVYTTGATLRDCARALKKAGAQVYALTIARTPLRTG